MVSASLMEAASVVKSRAARSQAWVQVVDAQPTEVADAAMS